MIDDELVRKMRDVLEQCSDALCRVQNYRIKDPSARFGMRHPMSGVPEDQVRDLGLRSVRKSEHILFDVVQADNAAREVIEAYDEAVRDRGRGDGI